jgi:hypothetical protein
MEPSVTSAMWQGFSYRARVTGYWATTSIIAWEMALGGAWDLLRVEYVRTIMDHLGYPLYVLSIIGIWKIPCAVTLVAPRFPRVKEWAYAGAFFNYTGAVASHLAVGDPASVWAGPLGFAIILVVSWALRPASRRM